MAAHWEVLIATADLETCRRLASILSPWGVKPICASTVGKAKAVLARQGVPMVFCEDRLADGSFRDVLGAARLVKSKVRVVVISRTSDENGYLEAIQGGAFDVIPSSCRPADVHRVVSHAMREDGERPHGPAFNDVHEIKVFYDRWKASVFRFCRLFLGYKDPANECVCEAFSNYLREKPALQTNALPPRLMGFALAAAKRRSLPVSSQASLPGHSLREKILCIPCDQRAVFILRSVLRMSDVSVALATELQVDHMRGLWLSSLFHLREILPRRFFERGAPGRQGHWARVRNVDMASGAMISSPATP